MKEVEYFQAERLRIATDPVTRSLRRWRTHLHHAGRVGSAAQRAARDCAVKSVTRTAQTCSFPVMNRSYGGTSQVVLRIFLELLAGGRVYTVSK